jgi:thymidylate synthase
VFLERYDRFDDAYWFLCHAVKNGGEWMAPRGGEITQEIRPCSFAIKDPTRALYTGVERRLNYRFFAIETAMYVSGRADAEAVQALCLANSNMRRFVNPRTGSFDGAYGPRLRPGLARCWHMLKANPWTRQAVASVWNNKEDMDTVDVPCTVAMQFFCTPLDGDNDSAPLLNLQVTMRSNDLDWGTPYDVAAFCEILCLMASSLGMPVGEYWHNAGSLHLYRDHHPKVDAPTVRTLLDREHISKCHGTMLKTWDDVSATAGRFVTIAGEELESGGGRFTQTQARRLGLEQDPWLQRLYQLAEFSWRSHGGGKT